MAVQTDTREYLAGVIRNLRDLRAVSLALRDAAREWRRAARGASMARVLGSRRLADAEAECREAAALVWRLWRERQRLLLHVAEPGFGRRLATPGLERELQLVNRLFRAALCRAEEARLACEASAEMVSLDPSHN